MSDTNHNLEVAKACGFDIESEPNAIHACSTEQLDAYTSRIYAEKESAIEAIDAELLSQQAERISELERIVAMQADELVEVKSLLAASIHERRPSDEYNDEIVEINEVLSASAESVAAWEAKKLEPLQREVAMLHDLLVGHDSSSNEWCAEVNQAINDTQATAEAYDIEHAAKVLEEAAKFFDEQSYTERDESGCVRFAEDVLRARASTLRAQSEQKKGGE